jgi:hypothetical protein
MPTISLAKAHRIENAIRAGMRTVDLKTTVVAHLFDDNVDQAVQEGAEALRANAEHLERLVQILTRLRTVVGDANHRSGIVALLTEKAGLEELQKLLPGGSSASSSTDDEDDIYGRRHSMQAVDKTALAGLVQAQRQRFTVADSVSSVVTVKVMTDAESRDTFSPAALARRRRIEEIGDRLRGLNGTTQIEIPEADMAYLERHGVL